MTSSTLMPPFVINRKKEEKEEKKLVGEQLLDDITSHLTGIGRSVVEASKEDDTTWTDDAIRLALGGAKNVGNVLNAPGIKQSLQVLGAPAWIVGKGLGWTLEKGGVDPRYGHIVGEVGEWFIPFYGAAKLVKKAKQAAVGLNAISDVSKATKATNVAADVAAATKASEKTAKIRGLTTQQALEQDGLLMSIKRNIDGFDDLSNANLLNQQPWFQKLDAFEQQRLIDELPQLMADMRRAVDDPLSMGFRTALGRARIGESTGRRLLDDADVMRYNEMRQASHDLPNKGRDWLQIYMTDKYSDLNTFGQQRIRRLPELRDEFAELIANFPGLGRQVQIHHIAALKATMGIFDGLQKGSPLYKDVADVLLKHIPGLGDETSNLLGVIGASKKAGTPHGLVHAFYREIIGEAGELFFTPEVLARMRYDRAFRLQKADELGRIIGESENIVKTAMEQLKKTQTPDITLYDVLRRVSKLDFLESLNILKRPRQDPLYKKPRLNDDVREQLIEKAIYQETRDFYDEIDPHMLKDQNLSRLYDMQRIISREFTELNVRLQNLKDANQLESDHAQRIIRQLSSTRDRQILLDQAIKKLEY